MTRLDGHVAERGDEEGDDEEEGALGADPAAQLKGHRQRAPTPAERSAAATTLVSSIARVIGPTPPGFGLR